MNGQKRWTTILMMGLALVLLLFFWSGIRDLLQTLELQSLTLRQRLHSLPPRDRSAISPVVLVNIDADTLGSAEMSRLFGRLWSRSAHAYAIRFFQRSRPVQVLFDLSFNGGAFHEKLAGDVEMVDSLRDTQVFGSALIFTRQNNDTFAFLSHPKPVREALSRHAVSISGVEQFPQYRELGRFNSMVPPFQHLLEESPMRFYAATGAIYTANLGTSLADQTGDIRRWIPFVYYGERFFPHLSLGALLKGEKRLSLDADGVLRWPGHQLRLGADGIPLIKWYGHGVDPRRPVYPEYSYEQVVLSEIALECREKRQSRNPDWCKTARLPEKPLDPALFEGKYVLIGFTSTNMDDNHKTIYSPKYPGVYILANILDNVLQDDFVHPAPFWLNALLFAGLLGLVGWALLRFQTLLMSGLISLSVCLGFFILTNVAYGSWNLWVYLVYPMLGAMALFVGVYFARYVRSENKKRQLRDAFGKYVSPALLQLIDQKPEEIRLGGQRREMTLLFCDIRGFTAFSETNPPEVVQESLTRYFSVMNGIILKQYRGNINKLIGDAIMAYWGFPLADEDHPYLAVRAALEMRDAIDRWSREPGNPPFQIGIGINTGEVIIGNVGSEDFMDFTVIGDAVNTAARLESATKEQGVRIIISGGTYARVRDRIEARYLGNIQVKGKAEPIDIYEPLGLVD